MYSYHCLEPSDATAFAGLTFPALRPALSSPTPSLERIGARLSRSPVGLGLLDCCAGGPGYGRILSIAVSAPHRGKGVGSELLRQLESRARQSGSVHTLQIRYAGNTMSRCALENALRKNAWSEPLQFMIVCRSTYELLSRAPWIRYDALLHSTDFDLVTWPELSESDWRSLGRGSQVPLWYPEELTPLVPEESVEPRASLFLRYRGAIVGWCVAEVAGPETLRCKQLFVRQDLEGRGRAVSILAAAIKRSATLGRTRYIFDTSASRHRMLQFIERRMRPYLESTDWFYQSVKLITKDPKSTC